MTIEPISDEPTQPRKAVLHPCRVPWLISPSMSGVTLVHTETSVAPECHIILCGGRLMATGLTDNRRIGVTFELCWHARVSPKYDDYDLDSQGFDLLDGAPNHYPYLDWLRSEWRSRDYCPSPGFWLASESKWLKELAINDARHYLISGRDSYVEVIARTYSWKEWIWEKGLREELLQNQPVAARGVACDSIET